MIKMYIAQSLLILMNTKDIKDITIGEITKKAGVHRSTYYRNFDSKESIIEFYYRQIIEEYRLSVSFDNTTIEDYLHNMFKHYYKYKNELLLLYKADMSHLLLKDLNELFNNAYHVDNANDLYLVSYHTGGIYNNFISWFSNDMKETPTEITNIILNFFPKEFKPILSFLRDKDF